MSQRRLEEWVGKSQITRDERTFPGRVNHIRKHLDSESGGFEEPEVIQHVRRTAPVAGGWGFWRNENNNLNSLLLR